MNGKDKSVRREGGGAYKKDATKETKDGARSF
jgi:hypothetical protein